MADYTMGIKTIDLKTKAVAILNHPVEVPLNGIDCLMRVGDGLVAIQNGVTPARVVGLRLDASGNEVAGVEILESNSPQLGTPTHGVLRGNRFYYLANTGFDNLDEKGGVASGKQLSPARVLFVELK